MSRPIQRPLAKGDVVKQRSPGGSLMTVVGINRDDGTVIASYKDQSGIRRDEEWRAHHLQRVFV